MYNTIISGYLSTKLYSCYSQLRHQMGLVHDHDFRFTETGLRHAPLQLLLEYFQILVGMVATLELHSMDDMDRKTPHKVSLSVLATLRPRSVKPIVVDTTSASFESE